MSRFKTIDRRYAIIDLDRGKYISRKTGNLLASQSGKYIDWFYWTKYMDNAMLFNDKEIVHTTLDLLYQDSPGARFAVMKLHKCY